MKRKSGKISHLKKHQSDPKALAEIQALLGDSPRRRDLLIEFLHRIQDRYKHISAPHALALAQEMRLSPAEVYEVATFYHHFDVIQENGTPPPELTVRVCDSLSCELVGAKQLIAGLKQKLGDQVRVQAVPCVGRCHAAPIAIVGQYTIDEAKIESIQQAVSAKQTKAVATHHITYRQYRETGGYATYLACTKGQRKLEDVIQTIEASQLRGLGGAGFSTGHKWRILRQQAKPRLVAINIDEGEPGTFKDRYYLERDPHRFIEGTLIAAWAIEADEVYFYLRDEYTSCRYMFEAELKTLQADPPCPLPKMSLRRGAGAYICGEESAMIESIEGKRGMPRLRPPYLAQVGLFGRPTLEQNMETMHWIRDILEQGADWFSARGRHGCQGLRSFSVSGRVKQPGVYLTDAGITVRELIDEYCGGMLAGHEFYAYFPGGASGGILPASMGDIPLDFGTLEEYGCFIGSAAIIILSDQDSVKQAALNTMRFFEAESCGQCTPCRVGTAKAVNLMEQDKWDRELLEELAAVMRDASICGLGQAAPNPLQCAIKYFPSEFA